MFCSKSTTSQITEAKIWRRVLSRRFRCDTDENYFGLIQPAIQLKIVIDPVKAEYGPSTQQHLPDQ
jgi:hypothetical protein